MLYRNNMCIAVETAFATLWAWLSVKQLCILLERYADLFARRHAPRGCGHAQKNMIDELLLQPVRNLRLSHSSHWCPTAHSLELSQSKYDQSSVHAIRCFHAQKWPTVSLTYVDDKVFWSTHWAFLIMTFTLPSCTDTETASWVSCAAPSAI